RKRWASKSTHYRNKAIVALGVAIWVFNALLLVAGAGLLLFNGIPFLMFAAAFSLKMFVESLFLFPLCKFARRLNLLGYLPLLSLLHIFYMVYIGVAGNIGKYQWKGRYVK